MTETKPTGVPLSDPGTVIQQLRPAAGPVRDSSKINQVESNFYILYNVSCFCLFFYLSFCFVGCEYGDKVSWCKDVKRSQCYHTDVLLYCCESCQKFRTQIPG